MRVLCLCALACAWESSLYWRAIFSCGATWREYPHMISICGRKREREIGREEESKMLKINHKQYEMALQVAKTED